jgi:hypothetical protein
VRVRLSTKVTGLARKLHVGPEFWGEIPTNGLKSAQLMGQPCYFHALHTKGPRRDGLAAGRTVAGRVHQQLKDGLAGDALHPNLSVAVGKSAIKCRYSSERAQ